jgi:hypothetical protein
MTHYTINHRDDAGNGRNNYSYGNYATQDEAINAMIAANMDNLATMNGDDNAIEVPLYRLTNMIVGGEAWVPGDISVNMGDYTEYVTEVDEDELAA